MKFRIQAASATFRASALTMIATGVLACASSPRAAPAPAAQPAAQPAVQPDTQAQVAAVQRFTPLAQVDGAFVVRLGVDTLAIERYSRTSQTLEGELIRREPRTRVFRYRATLDPDGRMSTFEATVMDPPGGPPSQPVRLEFTGGVVETSVPSGDSLRTNRIPVQGIAIPWIGHSYALAEQAIRQLFAEGIDSTTILQVGLGGQPPTAAYLRRRGPNVVELEYFGAPIVIRVDDAGRVQSADGSATATKVSVERVPTVSIAELATSFADRPLGQLSTRDTVSATLGGATLTVDYGRPFTRGRTIWGGVVPWNEVWRTGANEATHFTTSRDLVINGTMVPAGTYTLWTLPTARGATLIVNRQTGQWGTVYDPSQDLARIDVNLASLSEPMEQFTIAFVPSSSGGVMRLMWGDREVRVPIIVR